MRKILIGDRVPRRNPEGARGFSAGILLWVVPRAPTSPVVESRMAIWYFLQTLVSACLATERITEELEVGG
jgi:hypothetical protein